MHNPVHEAAGHAGFWAQYGLMIFSGALSIVGIFTAYVLYVQQNWIPGFVKATFPRTHRTLYNKYYVDELYDACIVTPMKKTGRFCVGLDDYLIDGLLWLATAIPRAFGYVVRVLQNGLLQGYGLGMVAGIALVVLLVFWK